jgi:uncharacterized membrane protein YtjA (UPF0391 family)
MDQYGDVLWRGREPVTSEGTRTMLYTIAIILLILWLAGFAFHVAGGLIHILLVIAVIVVLVKLFTGRNVV